MKISTAMWTLEALIKNHANQATIHEAAAQRHLTHHELIAANGNELAIIGNDAESLVVSYDAFGKVNHCGYRPIGVKAREKLYDDAYQQKRRTTKLLTTKLLTIGEFKQTLDLTDQHLILQVQDWRGIVFEYSDGEWSYTDSAMHDKPVDNNDLKCINQTPLKKTRYFAESDRNKRHQETIDVYLRLNL